MPFASWPARGARREYVRSGCERSLIEAVRKFDAESPDLFLSREITDAGKSYGRINGRLAPLADLKREADSRIIIHGQNDNQTIYHTDTHRKLLDAFAAERIGTLLATWQNQVRKRRQLVNDADELGRDPQARERRLDLLNYQISEIEAAGLSAGEEEKLLKRQRVLVALERITEGVGLALDHMDSDGAAGVFPSLDRALAALVQASRYSKSLTETEERLINVRTELLDIRRDMGYMDRLDYQPSDVEVVEERLDELRRLKDLYGQDAEHILLYADEAKAERDRLEQGRTRFASILDELNAVELELDRTAAELHDVRRTAAEHLQEAITAELRDLGMMHVRFAVVVKAQSREEPLGYASYGRDDVSFEIAPNPGEPLKPLVMIASGGEAARVFLAIQTILASVEETPTLIFDEIDTGISGIVAGKVASKLQQIAVSRQVLCVSHMALLQPRQITISTSAKRPTAIGLEHLSSN